MRIEKQEVIQYLSNLCETEFIEIFYNALESKKFCKHGEIGAYCITLSSFDLEASSYYRTHDTVFLALPTNWNGFDENTSDEYLQFGKCSQCKACIVCIEKEALCPICGNIVGCT